MQSPANSTTLGWNFTNFCNWILNFPKKSKVITLDAFRFPWDLLSHFMCIPMINPILELTWMSFCFLQEKAPDSWTIISIAFFYKQVTVESHLLFKNLNVCIKSMSTMLLKINIHPISNLKFLSIHIWFNSSILRRANNSKQSLTKNQARIIQCKALKVI